MWSKTMLVILTSLLVGLVAVACSSPTPSPTATPTEAPGTEVEGAALQETEAGHAHEEGEGHAQKGSVIEGAREVHLTATEFAYETKTITVIQGKPVILVLTNKRGIEHELEVGAFGLHLHVKPGETAKGSFVPEPGVGTGRTQAEMGALVPFLGR